MTKKRLPAKAAIKALPAGFSALLGEVKLRIQSAQTRAMTAVNTELVRLYWDIGRLIDERQKAEGWGASVIPRLAAELRNELPEIKGFSARNIGRMIAFFRAYPEPRLILPQAVAKLPSDSKLPQAVAKTAGDSLLWAVPWGHHACLLEKVKDPACRRWYVEQTLANGWSRNVLTAMIDGQAHERVGRAVTNFEQLLPSPQSDLAQQALKDPYIFDFLTLTEPFHERELETGLLQHLEKFLLELGQGFAFVGRQFRLEVAADDYYIDLLFYHLRLRAFVVIDLKTGHFKPEYAGKLNFYCNVVNEQLRHAADQPTIGLILCQTKDNVLAEYALAGIDKPIGVSSYELTRALPPSLQSALPSVEQIEAEIAAAETATEKAPKQKRKKPTKKKPPKRKKRKPPRSGGEP
jgi:predicted nuclease of restriction endonuclease-like (RecB) superfamily